MAPLPQPSTASVEALERRSGAGDRSARGPGHLSPVSPVRTARPGQVDPRGPQSPSSLLELQRLAGNRAVSSLVSEESPTLQRLFGWGKKSKKPSTAEQISAGFSAMAGEKGSDQLKALAPYAEEIGVLAEKGKISAEIDKAFGGGEALLREGLKTAVLLSSWSAEKINERLAAINVKGQVDANQRKAVDKLVVELAKSAKKDKSATYKALYGRCVQATGGLTDEFDAEFEASKLENEDEATAALRKNVRNVSKISAMSFEMAYAEQLLKTREETLAAYEQQGKKPVETIVLGAGPVGMMAAIEAFMAGANVHVYEMRRSGPSRANVLTLDQDTLAKLRRLGVYSALYGPDHTKGDTGVSNGVSVQYLEDMLRARATQLGIKITYGYELETITAPDKDGGKTTVRLKKYVPTRPGPEKEIYDAMQSQKGGDKTKDVIDAQSDLVVGATGAGFTTGKALGLERERKQDEKGEDHRDFTGVGMFEPAKGDDLRPTTDTLDGVPRWINPIRTPKVNYLLTQVSRENFVKFQDKKNEGERDKYLEARGRLIGYKGKLRASSVFEITLSQAKTFANEIAGGVVIGDEAATPHPKTGSGFNTGARSTGAIGGLVRGIGGGERKKAFGTFGQSMKSRTDLMMKKALSVFNAKTFVKPSKAPTPPPSVGSGGIGGEVAKTVNDANQNGGGEKRGYTPEDIGVTPETEYEYQLAQEKVMSLYGLGPRRGYDPEDIGVTPETEPDYEGAQDKTDSLFGIGPEARRGYTPEDIGVTPENEVDYRAIQERIDALFGIPTKRELLGEETGVK